MPKAQSIDKLIGVTKERLELMIKKLKPEYQEFINEKFDKNYNRKKHNWSEEDRIIFYNKIRKSLKKQASKDINMGRNLKKHFTKKIGITKEVFWENFHLYSIKVQQFTKSHFDDSLIMLSDYDLWTDEEKKYYNESFVEHIKLVTINSKTSRSYQSIPDKFGITKDEFQIIYESLSSKAKAIVSKYYDANFRPIISLKWKHGEKRYMFNFIYKKIEEAIAGAPLKTYQKTYHNLLEKYHITKSQMRFIISKTKKHYQVFINYVFDENYEIKRDVLLSEEEIHFLQSNLSVKIKKMIKKYNIDLINEQTIQKETNEKVSNILTESFKPIPKKDLPETIYLENEKIRLLKLYYQKQYDYLNSLKQQDIKLTLKKD